MYGGEQLNFLEIGVPDHNRSNRNLLHNQTFIQRSTVMKPCQLKAFCIGILGVSTKADDKRDGTFMEMRSVLDEQERNMLGLAVVIAPIKTHEFYLMAFSMDNSKNADETLNRCLPDTVGNWDPHIDLNLDLWTNERNQPSADSHVLDVTRSNFFYEPERRDDLTYMANFHVHSLGCWNISSSLKTRLYRETKLKKSRETWSVLDTDEFFRLSAKGVYIIHQNRRGNLLSVSFSMSNAEESDYILESDLVFDKIEYGGILSKNQMVEIRFGDDLVKLPEDLYEEFLRKLQIEGYKISEDRKYKTLIGERSSYLALFQGISIPVKQGICLRTPQNIDSVLDNHPARVALSENGALVLGFAYLLMSEIGIDTRGETKKYNFFCRKEKLNWEAGEKRKELSESFDEDSRAKASNKRQSVSSSTNAAEASSSMNNRASADHDEIKEEYGSMLSDED